MLGSQLSKTQHKAPIRKNTIVSPSCDLCWIRGWCFAVRQASMNWDSPLRIVAVSCGSTHDAEAIPTLRS